MATVAPPEFEVEPVALLPDDALYEIIDGIMVEMPPMGTYPVEVATIISAHLDTFARRNGIGRVLTEALIRIDSKNQKRPDVAFFSYQKWPKGRRTPSKQPFEVTPDLVIEVISETDRAWEVMEKTRDYFKAGVRAVWLVYPNLELIHIYDSFTQIRVMTRDDELDGGNLIPGFRLPLATVFEEETEEDTPVPTAPT